MATSLPFSTCTQNHLRIHCLPPLYIRTQLEMSLNRDHLSLMVLKEKKLIPLCRGGYVSNSSQVLRLPCTLLEEGCVHNPNYVESQALQNPLCLSASPLGLSTVGGSAAGCYGWSQCPMPVASIFPASIHSSTTYHAQFPPTSLLLKNSHSQSTVNVLYISFTMLYFKP